MTEEYDKAIEIYKTIGATDRIIPLYEDLVVKTRLDAKGDIASIKRDLRAYYAAYNQGEYHFNHMVCGKIFI